MIRPLFSCGARAFCANVQQIETVTRDRPRKGERRGAVDTVRFAN